MNHTASPTPQLRDVQAVAPDYRVPGRLAGRTLLITGGSRGIGKATALRAAREGASVVVADCLDEPGQQVVAQIRAEQGRAIFVQADVCNGDDCDRMVHEAVSAFGSLDLVLNGAGVMDGVPPADAVDLDRQRELIFAPIHAATDAYWERVLAVNTTGMFKAMRSQLRQMLAQGRGGAIVNIGSIAAITGLAGNPAYVASKHAVTGLTRNAAIDYAPYGIRVNSVNMAGTETPMTDAAYKKVMQLETERAQAAAAASQEAGAAQAPNVAFAKSMSLLALCDSKHRMSTPAEQAAVILFLLSDEASNITGAAWATDGGWTTY
jgi:NAD(P)-dependent dehydrogenase (short-subunit alcohol dehydrogenase family)